MAAEVVAVIGYLQFSLSGTTWWELETRRLEPHEPPGGALSRYVGRSRLR